MSHTRRKPKFSFGRLVAQVPEPRSGGGGAEAAGNAKGADPSGVAGGAGFQVIADVPEGAVVGWVHGGGGVIFPTEGIVLRGLAFHEDGLLKGQLPLGVAGASRGETLAGEIRAAAEGVADTDVPLAVHADACLLYTSPS